MKRPVDLWHWKPSSKRLEGDVRVRPGHAAVAEDGAEPIGGEDREEIVVLHVDDDPQLLDLSAVFLERLDEDLEVITAESPDEGTAILADRPVHAIVSDFEMPETDGLEFLAAVRDRDPDLPFILFTGKGGEEIASEAIGKGVTDYLQKGKGTDQFTVLANRLANAVDSYRARREAAWSHAHLQAIAENVSDVVLTIDAESRIRFVNPAVEALFGYDPATLEGERLTRLMPDRHRADHENGIERFIETGQRAIDWRGVAFPGLTADGEEIPLSISFGAFEQGGERYFTGIIREREPSDDSDE